MCALVTDSTVHPITAYQQNIVVTNLNLHHSRSQEQHSQKSWILHRECASNKKTYDIYENKLDASFSNPNK